MVRCLLQEWWTCVRSLLLLCIGCTCFPGQVIPVTWLLVLHWLTCQVPDRIGLLVYRWQYTVTVWDRKFDLQLTLAACTLVCADSSLRYTDMFTSSPHLFRSLADRWGICVDVTTSVLHSSRFSAFHSMMFHSRPVHSLMLSSVRFLCPPLHLPPCTVPL